MDLNNIKCLIPCFLALLVGAVVFTPSPAPAVAFPPAADSASPFLSTLVLTDSWPIQKVVSIPSGDLVFAGGDFQSGADGLVLVAPDKFVKLAATGDPVPGYSGLYLGAVGIKVVQNPYSDYRYTSGYFSFNRQGELAFSANIVSCSSSSLIAQCAQSSPPREGLFLFSDKSRITIALQGDPAPGLDGSTFRSFDQILINGKGTVVFAARLTRPGGIDTYGLFLFSGNRLDKIVVYDWTSTLNRISPSPQIGLFLYDEDTVTFVADDLDRGDTLFRYENGVLTRVLASGDPLPEGGSLGGIVETASNNHGDIVFHSSSNPNGIYFRGADNSISKIIKNGDISPIGGQFVLVTGSTISSVVSVTPEVNDSGDVLFRSPIGGGAAGLFLATKGEIRKIAADGDPVPGYSFQTMVTTPLFTLNNLGVIAFSAHTNYGLVVPALYSSSKGIVSKVIATGDVASGTDGASFKDLKEFFISDLNDVIFHSTLCCGKYKEGIFRASLPPGEIPNGGFETPGDNGLPASWQTAWSNSGSGEASRFECGAGCAFEGNSVLRLHVNPGGGSMFVVSDPIPISPDAAYLISSQLRYYLNSNSDAVYFSLIQSDSAGTTVGFEEVTGNRQDNSWTWVPKGMLIRSKPGARSIRIRIGLVCSSESYLDIDAVR